MKWKAITISVLLGLSLTMFAQESNLNSNPNLFLLDSLAIDTFPPPRNLDGYTQDGAVRLWWEVPLLPDTLSKGLNLYQPLQKTNPEVESKNGNKYMAKDGRDIQVPFNFPQNANFVVPANLIGYNIYRNENFLDYLEYDGNDTTFYWDFSATYPAFYHYTVTALYDLAPAGMPGDTAESEPAGPKEFWVGYDFILPYWEEWSTGSFDPNLWTADSCWFIFGQEGNPEPAAGFQTNTVDTNYSHSLISYWINCHGIAEPYIDGDFFLEFDIKLVTPTSSGTEVLRIDIADSLDWQNILTLDNSNGSYDWEHIVVNITEEVKGKTTRLAFVAEGEDASNINAWYIDNINLYRKCNPPQDFHWAVPDQVLAWSPPLPHTPTKTEAPKELQGYRVYVESTMLGFTTDTFHVLDQYYGFGPYWVTALYEDCEGCSEGIFGSISQKENSIADKIRIWPNPGKGIVHIESPEAFSKLSIFSSHGKGIREYTGLRKSLLVDLSDQCSGLYFIVIKKGDQTMTKKILLRK